MTEEVSKRIIVVLLVLTILISVVGTWTVLTSAERQTAFTPPATDTGKGQITLKILPAPTEGVPNG